MTISRGMDIVPSCTAWHKIPITDKLINKDMIHKQFQPVDNEFLKKTKCMELTYLCHCKQIKVSRIHRKT